MNLNKQRILALLGLFWFLALSAGFKLLWDYSRTPGEGAGAPVTWPRQSGLNPPGKEPVLVMVIHPLCPCSRASVEELNRLMGHLRGKARVHALVVDPAGVPGDWRRSQSFRSLTRIPGVAVRVDGEGVEAGKFGAKTSGQVLLYGKDGRLLFSGGITPDRGHRGDSPGRGYILSFLAEGWVDRRASLVFGCPLGTGDTRAAVDGWGKRPEN